jgi:hypothetical protein
MYKITIWNQYPISTLSIFTITIWNEYPNIFTTTMKNYYLKWVAKSAPMSCPLQKKISNNYYLKCAA